MTTNIPELRALMEKATPVPWRKYKCYKAGPIYGGEDDHSVAHCPISETPNELMDNSTLIVAAINALPSLLSELEAARKVVEAARSSCDHGDLFWYGSPDPRQERAHNVRVALDAYDQAIAK